MDSSNIKEMANSASLKPMLRGLAEFQSRMKSGTDEDHVAQMHLEKICAQLSTMIVRTYKTNQIKGS
jgi:hypothetical protein